MVYESALFSLEGFSSDKMMRFARCDYRGGRHKRTTDVDCTCRLWISLDSGCIVKVVNHSAFEAHSHEVMPQLVDYHKLKLRQNTLQDADLTKVI